MCFGYFKMEARPQIRILNVSNYEKHMNCWFACMLFWMLACLFSKCYLFILNICCVLCVGVFFEIYIYIYMFFYCFVILNSEYVTVQQNIHLEHSSVVQFEILKLCLLVYIYIYSYVCLNIRMLIIFWWVWNSEI